MYLIIFLITILLSLKTSWTYNNFTYLSYQENLRIYYLIWITILSFFLLFKVTKLFKKINFNIYQIKLLTGFSFLSMLIGSYLPYYPESNNISSYLHVLLSLTAIISLLLIIYFLIKKIYYFDFQLFQTMISLFFWQLFVIMMFIVMFGNINTIIELFVIGVILFDLAKIEKSVS
ncbi:hypothetical protein [uncultured Thomasclavelia sp.]|uniref:hypothetical protein n=1 Tax=uncultured Thomasclavelia sp. TaxID=3025759 RepID=UPI0025EDED79|nr:hypothetical protein [uncultured Thomasclavelia sp.]